MAVAPATSSDFLELLLKSGLMDEAGLNKLGDLPEEATKCAAVLISKGVITKFQSKFLLNGRYKGFKLGAYFILEQIGQGGMGAVYLAMHETLRRKVGLKVLTLSKDGNKALSIERFLREARSAAALDHPNIVRLHDVGKTGDTNFLVMEYIEGQTLDEIITRTGPITASRAVEYIAQAAAGLQHASEKGFVHRDIKPANLMLTKDGTIKILDMGLARPTDEESSKLTEVMDKGAIVGTADFISPEQAMNGDLDVRSDIYSLGATFFALVTGQPPFSGNSTQKLIQHQLKEAPSVQTIDKTFPPGLSAVVSKMLAKKPADRYQSPAEIIKAVAEWLPQQAGARVTAAISGTDLAHSQEMQSTLSEVSSGGTKRFGTKTRLNSMNPELPAKWFWPGMAAGVLVLAGMTTAIIILAGGDPTPETLSVAAVDPPKEKKSSTTTSKKSPAKAPTKESPKPSEPPPAAPASALYALDLTSQKAFVDRGRALLKPGSTTTKVWTSVEKIGDGFLPAGWTGTAMRTDSVVEFSAKTFDGRMALGCRTAEGANSVYLSAPKFETTAGKVSVSFEYRVDRSGTGLVLKFAQYAPARKTSVEVHSLTGAKTGEWNKVVQEIDLNGATAGRIEFHPRGTVKDYVWIRNLIIAPPEAGEKVSRSTTLYSEKFDRLKPAQIKLETVDKIIQVKAIDSVALPVGIHINQHRTLVSGEYAIADVDGIRCLGLRLITGETGVQFHATCGDAISNGKPGESYRIRIVYRHDGTGNGIAGIQQPKAPFTKFQLTPLTPTGGQWRTIDLIFVRPNDAEKYDLILNAGAKTDTLPAADGMIYFQSIEVSGADSK